MLLPLELPPPRRRKTWVPNETSHYGECNHGGRVCIRVCLRRLAAGNIGKSKKRRDREGLIDFFSGVFMVMVNEDRLEMIHLLSNLFISPLAHKRRDKQILGAAVCLKGNQMNGSGCGNTLTHSALEVALQTQCRPFSI